MTKQEIEAFLQKPEVLEVIKDNLEIELWNEPCEGIMGYDIYTEVRLFGKLVGKDSDCI
jgi:hypothetical protein